MGIAYVGSFTFGSNYHIIQNVPAMFVRIFEEAFDFKAIFGAFSGSAMMQGTIRRGLIIPAGGGYPVQAPNASVAANVSHPVKPGQGLQMLSCAY
ncbi:MAG: alanine:cation symporter family protein [Dorea sp.]